VRQWAPFTVKDDTFSGEINNEPRPGPVRLVRLGETITFDQLEIVDWMHMDGDKMKGNYTACARLKSACKQGGRRVQEMLQETLRSRL